MQTSDLFASLGYKLGYDTYSPYQITDSLNYVMKEINVTLNSISSSLITTDTTLTLVDNEADLPTDFESMISVDSKINIPITCELDSNTYQIVGNKIKTQGETVTIYYKKSYPEYVYDTAIAPTTIDLPVSFDNMIKDSIVALLTGQPMNVQLQTIKLIANRDGKKRPQRLVFNL